MKEKLKKYQSKKMNCLACGILGVDLHHIKTRKSGGCDSHFNLMPLCRIHHVEIHKIGMNSMAEKYPKIMKFLIDNSYTYCLIRNKWVRYLQE